MYVIVNHYSYYDTNIILFLNTDCVWYGTTFCDGDVVEDLYRWWFKMRCSNARFSVDSSSWADVISRKKKEGIV